MSFAEGAQSSAERTTRRLLDELARVDDQEPITLTLGMVRDLLADIDMLREITTEDRSKWSFEALLFIGRRLLDTVYPETVFTGTSVGTEAIARVIDEQLRAAGVGGGASAAGVRAAAKAVSDLLQNNSGVGYVVALREALHRIENK